MMEITTTPGALPVAEERWTPRLALSLVSIVLLLELLAISYAMVAMALPAISAHYRTAQGAWLITSLLLVGAILGPIVGKLADLYGKRKLLLACAAVATVGSLISAVAPTYGVLILGRSLTGALAPCVFLGYSLIRDVFPRKTVAFAVSVTTSGLGLVTVPAPFLTGWLLDRYGFRSIFWFFTIGLVVSGVLIALSTDESPVRLRSRIDLLGAALLGAGIAGILVAVSFGPTWGWTEGSTLAYLFGGVALIVTWLVSAGLVSAPLIDLKVLCRRPVFLTALVAGLVYAASALFSVLLPMLAMTPAMLRLGYGFGLSAKRFAVFQAPLAIMCVVGGVVVGALVARNVRPRLLLIVGTVLLAAALLLMSVRHDTKGLVMVFAGLFGLGVGLSFSAIPNLLIEAVPPQLQASTASIVNISQSVVAAALPVVVFAVLNGSYTAPFPPALTHGATFYTDRGFQVAFLIGGVAVAFATLLALLLPRRIDRLQLPAEQAATEEPTAVVLGH